MEIAQSPGINGLQMRGRTVYILAVSAVAALGAVMFGFDIAIISGAAPFVQKKFSLDALELGWGVSSLIVGCMGGALLAGRFADAYGRRRTLLSIALLFAASSIATAAAPGFSDFFLARIVGGIAVGAASMISPLYIAELSPSAIRGRLVGINQLGITFGCLVSYLINYFLRDAGATNWRWMFATGAIPSLAFFVLLFFVPESPRWLYRTGQEDRARAVLVRVGGAENAERELALMRTSPHHRTAGTIRDLLHRRYRRVMIVGALLAMLVQASGINTVIAYAPIIFRSIGNRLDTALFQTFLIGIVNFLCTFFAIFFVDRFGRRALYFIGSSGMAIALLLLSAGFHFDRLRGTPGLIVVLMFIASFAGCIGPVYWILMAEMFPTRIRGAAMSVAVFICWFFNFLVLLLFPWLMKVIGGAPTFLFLALMAVAMFFVAWKFMPETAGRTLEQIDEEWSMGVE